MIVLAGLQGLTDIFTSQVEQQIFIHLRLPVLITAVLVGAGLSVSSAVLQVLLRNPLADPGIIGVTSGASLLAAIVLLVGGTALVPYIQYALPIFCFVGALFSTFLISAIAGRMTHSGTAIILTGIAISTLCGAIVAWLYLFSDAQSMRNLTFWIMGSLHQSDWAILSVAGPVMLLLIVYLCKQGKSLNCYYFGETDAKLAGIDVSKLTKRLLFASAILVGAAVSIAGSIAFLGLLVPHMLRNFFGYNNQFILPASAMAGAILMLGVVLLSGLYQGINIPVSMVTATLGGPIFLYSIIQAGRREL